MEDLKEQASRKEEAGVGEAAGGWWQAVPRSIHSPLLVFCQNTRVHKIHKQNELFGFQDRFSLCSPGCPGARSID